MQMDWLPQTSATRSKAVKSKTKIIQTGEIYFILPTLRIFAPVEMTDEEGIELYPYVKGTLDGHLLGVKTLIEEKFPQLRVGYDTDS
jgi:hypothetical protein